MEAVAEFARLLCIFYIPLSCIPRAQELVMFISRLHRDQCRKQSSNLVVLHPNVLCVEFLIETQCMDETGCRRNILDSRIGSRIEPRAMSNAKHTETDGLDQSIISFEHLIASLAIYTNDGNQPQSHTHGRQAFYH